MMTVPVKKPSKTKYIIWYLLFGTYNQFKREGKWGTYIFANIFNICIWLLAYVFFSNTLFNTGYACFAFPFFTIIYNGWFSAIEKYAESFIGYDLSRVYVVNNRNVLTMRMFTKMLQPSEWIMYILLFYSILNTTFSTDFKIIALISCVLSNVLFQEIIALVEYNVNFISKWNGLIWSTLLATSVFTVFFVKEKYMSSNCLIYITILFAVLATVIAVIIFTKNDLYIKQTVKKKQSHAHKHSLKLAQKNIIDKSSLLFFKEFVLLFKHKTSVLISASTYAILAFAFFEKTDTMIFLLPMMFVVDFCFSYGFHYVGIEEETLQSVLNSTTDLLECIVKKNIIMIIVSTVVSLIITLVFCVLKQEFVNTFISCMATSIIVLSMTQNNVYVSYVTAEENDSSAYHTALYSLLPNIYDEYASELLKRSVNNYIEVDNIINISEWYSISYIQNIISKNVLYYCFYLRMYVYNYNICILQLVPQPLTKQFCKLYPNY